MMGRKVGILYDHNINPDTTPCAEGCHPGSHHRGGKASHYTLKILLFANCTYNYRQRQVKWF